jgi:hypothetical protein
MRREEDAVARVNVPVFSAQSRLTRTYLKIA